MSPSRTSCAATSQGLLVRTAFCATFALLAVPLGGLAASAAAALAAAAAALLAHRVRARRQRELSLAHAAPRIR